MSDLSNCGCGCESNMDNCGGYGRSGGCSNNSCLWMILLLVCCGGCGGGFGRGDGCGNDSCLWIILLLACCGGCGSGFGLC